MQKPTPSNQWLKWLHTQLTEAPHCMSSARVKYFTTMERFFTNVTDPTDLNQLMFEVNPEPAYAARLNQTSKLSGLNDVRVLPDGREFYVEEQSVLG